MGMGSGGGAQSTPTTTTTSTEPWSATARQGLSEGYQGATDLYHQGPPQYYPGQTTVPFSPQTEAALTGTENMARDVWNAPQPYNKATNTGGPGGGTTTWGPESLAGGVGPGGSVIPTAVGTARNIMGGGMLNANPWLDRTFNQAADAVQGRMGSAFGGSVGGFGSGMHRAAMGSTLNDLATSIYGGNYARERGAQDAMLNNAGTFEEMRYDPARRLGAVGAAREGQAGTELNADIGRWNYNQNAPQEALSRLLAQLSGGQFQTATQTGQSFSNPLATYGGLGIGLLSALGNLGARPWG